MRIGGRYTLRERIGAGGMGEVWLARDEGDEGFEKAVVIKRMLPEAASYLDYFRAEAKLVARLPHQNIVQVLNFFVDEEGQHNIVMEYVEGTDVEELTFSERGRLTVPMAIYIASEALRGLEFAHTARIDGAPAKLVHRDVSPHNLLVSYAAEVKVTDFGVAKASVEYRHKTQGHKFRGKLAYAPPEAIDAREDTQIDHRVDIYSLGVVLYEMLAKRRCFGGSMWQMLMAVKEGTVAPLSESNPEMPIGLEEVVRKMMHPEREQRFASAREARAALLSAVPEGATADQVLKDFVQKVARRSMRMTSPFLDVSPAHGHVVLAAADEPTRQVDAMGIGSGHHRLAPSQLPPTVTQVDRRQVHPRSPSGGTPTVLFSTPEPTGEVIERPRLTDEFEDERHERRVRLATRIMFVVAALCVSAATVAVWFRQKQAVSIEETATASAPTPPPGTLIVEVHDEEPGDVYLDGVLLGPVPLKRPVTPGPHKVTLDRPHSGKRSDLDILVEPGRRQQLNF